MVKAKVYIFAKQFDGYPKKDDLQLVEEELPPVKEGEFLAEAVFLSVDPYMRSRAPHLPLGSVYIGTQVARILESKNPKFPVGKYVVGQFGWRTHTIAKGENGFHPFPDATLLSDLRDLPLSLGVGVFGMPGLTAYFGFLNICKPKRGQTVIISGAAGAVGSIVGQVAKIKGLTVIGVTGSDEKGKRLVEELGFDHFINYKTDELDKAIQKVAPKGIDCYFDNVGGEISSIIQRHMNEFGRVSVCGWISGYNDKDTKASNIQFNLAVKQLTIKGFIVYRWLDQSSEAISQLQKWIEEGQLKCPETVTEGFENMPKAFVDMLKGGNFGKAVVKV